MQHKRSKGAYLVFAIGFLLIVTALFPILKTSDLLVYTAVAPDGESIKALVQSSKDAIAPARDAIQYAGVSANKSRATLSAEEGASATASLVGAGAGWFEMYPRFLVNGRLPTETELLEGAAVVALDEDLAFTLFPTRDPIGETVNVEGTDFAVVGVVRHRRSVGEIDQYCAYIPLAACYGMSFDTISLSARPIANSGATIMFAGAVRSAWLDGGVYYDMGKEASRATLPLRMLATLAGIGLTVVALRWVNRFALARFAGLKRRLEREYAVRLFPRILVNIAACAALYALLLAVVYLFARWAVAPLYTFPEWVPENPVEWSSIKAVFWNLVSQNSALVTVSTPEISALRFWSGLVSGGTLLVLAGALLHLLPMCFPKRSGRDTPQ